MESFIGGNPNVRPKFTLESSTADVLAAHDTEEGGEDKDQSSAAESSSTTKGKPAESGCKRRKRKRKSKSSAAEMLTFLSSYVMNTILRACLIVKFDSFFFAQSFLPLFASLV